MKWRLLLLLSLAPVVRADDKLQYFQGSTSVKNWPDAYPQPVAASATLTTVTVSTTSVILLPARTGRLKVTLYNEKETLYLRAGVGASSMTYTWRMGAATPLDIGAYTGPISAALGVVGPTIVHVSDF